MRYRPALLAALLVTLGTPPAPVRSQAPVDALIRVTREADSLWRVDYTFARPILSLHLGSPVMTFRTSAWQVLSPGIALAADSAAERIRGPGGGFTHASVRVRRFTGYPPADYVPVLPFSDGGAALFLGFLTGIAETATDTVALTTRFELVGLPGEVTLLPEGPPGARPSYAWFGRQMPVDAGDARLLLDPAVPDWLRGAFEQTVPAVTPVLSQRLGAKPATPPLVFIAAGELTRHAGYSVKGGVVGSQFVLAMRGRDLLEQTPEGRRRFMQLTAHELAHVWQQVGWPDGWNMREPWIHEGSAEAMAVGALVASGLWGDAEREAYAKRASAHCATARGDGTLADLVASGNWGAVYPCGYGLFSAEGVDVFEAWKALVAEARRRGAPYSQAMLDDVLKR